VSTNKRKSNFSSFQSFAADGLRTLCLAVRELDVQFFRAWKKRHHDAASCTDNREERLEAVYNEIEKDMDLLGRGKIFEYHQTIHYSF
jgi:phospholipid-translocating ATPase